MKWLGNVVITVLLVSAPGIAVAAPVSATTLIWSVAAGTEITARDDNYLEVAVRSQRETFWNWKASLGTWSKAANGCVAVITGKHTMQWRGDFGLCYGERDKVGVDSLGRYRLGVWYRARERVSIGLLHFSCNSRFIKELGLPDIIPRCPRGTANKGLNFLTVEWQR